MDGLRSPLASIRSLSESLLTDYERVAATGISEAEAELRWDELLEEAGL